MEAPARIEHTEESHTRGELRNLWTCQRITREWTSHPEWDSYDVLPVLLIALHTGQKKLPGARSSPKMAEVVRNSTAFLPGSPANLLAPPENVYLLISRYSTLLDDMLRQKAKSLTQAVQDAARAYYIFDRIHPFPDGNGRIGRMIIKRVLKGVNAKDPLFHDQRWFGAKRSEYLQALEIVDRTNNLAPYELFIAKSLLPTYDPIREFFRYRELSTMISQEQRSLPQTENGRTLTDIWSGFQGISMYRNQPATLVPR